MRRCGGLCAGRIAAGRVDAGRAFLFGAASSCARLLYLAIAVTSAASLLAALTIGCLSLGDKSSQSVVAAHRSLTSSKQNGPGLEVNMHFGGALRK